jgi:RND family efflux transporter MFP subunit
MNHASPLAARWRTVSSPTLWLAGSAVSVVAVAVALLVWPQGTQAQASSSSAPSTSPAKPAVKPAMTVTVEAPTSLTWTQTLTANGSLAAWQEAIVGTEANGLRLVEVRAQVGDRVKAGQVLAVFDDQSVRAELAQARAALAETQANAAEAQANADRARSLQSTGAMSEQQIAQYTTAAVTAQARVASAQASLDVQALRLKHAQVLAPDSGVVSARSAAVGAVLPAGTELFRLIRQGRLEWRAEVTAADLARVKAGQVVRLQAASGVGAQGRVRMVGPTVDPQTRTALVYVDVLPGAPDAIKAGMFATGELALGQSAATTVPQQAVVNRDGFTYLFVLASDAGPDPRVQRLKVQVGRRVGDRVEVISGLPTGGGTPKVVTQGAGFLNDGDVVKVVNVVKAANQVAAAPSEGKK